MAEYSRLLPICHGFLARPVTYYLKWCANRAISFARQNLRPSRFAACFGSRHCNTVWRFAMASVESKIRRMGCLAAAAALVLCPEISRADESGISFWLPGLEGSLAATPTTPGWSLGTIYYHTSVNASGAAAAAREFQVGRFSPTVNINLNLNLSGQADLLFIAPTYTFATPLFGGQASMTLAGVYGRNTASLAGTL